MFMFENVEKNFNDVSVITIIFAFLFFYYTLSEGLQDCFLGGGLALLFF